MYKERAQYIKDLRRKAEERRLNCLNLIASENFQSEDVREELGTDFANRYGEHIDYDYCYEGTEEIAEIEKILEEDIKKLFNCKSAEVRPISGTQTNDIVFYALANLEDKIIVNSVPNGGHISHHKSGSLKRYLLDPKKQIIDLPTTEDGYHTDPESAIRIIEEKRPSLIVMGKSLILFREPVRELRPVCDKVGTKIVYDASHIFGLGEQFQAPLGEGAHILTASTHKTFFGPQRGVILSNLVGEEWEKIKAGAFPGKESNHHLASLVGLAIATCEVLEFGGEYAKQVIKNAKMLAYSLDKRGLSVEAKEFGFTETHQVAVDVSDYGRGKETARRLSINNIITSKSLLPKKDKLREFQDPSGIRFGVQEMTRFGMREGEMGYIAELIADCLNEKNVKEEVVKFRKNFQTPKYTFGLYLDSQSF